MVHGQLLPRVWWELEVVHPNTLVIVLEWATDGDLQCHLRRIRDRGGALPEPVIWQSFVQICEALAHMHERRILHRDLKPANIFLHRDGTIKVGDLGLGRTLSDDPNHPATSTQPNPPRRAARTNSGPGRP